MSTIHVHETTSSTPEQFVAGLTDFRPGRSKLFGNSADDYLKVHDQGLDQADVTEGSRGVWERLHYDWSDPNRVVLTTTDSNLWGGDSGFTYTFTRQPNGTTDVDVVLVREGKNLKGRLLAIAVGAIGKRALAKELVRTVKAIEARNDGPRRRAYEGRPAMRADIQPGATFPDYELPDHESVPRKLSELQGDDPLILTLARGHYCPKEHQQHLELAAFYPKIAVAYTQIATITTDPHHTLQEFRDSVGAQWPFLSDPERIVQKDLDIQEYTDPEHNPMIPHTLVLGPGLVVHSIYNGYWFWGRPSVADLWHDLRAVTREIRPDWDLSAPGLREAWDDGDLSAFHGWDGWESRNRVATEKRAK